jgi:hypothetical protein
VSEEYTPEEVRKDQERTARFHATQALRYVDIGHLGLAMENLRLAVRYLSRAEEAMPSTISNQEAVECLMAERAACEQEVGA